VAACCLPWRWSWWQGQEELVQQEEGVEEEERQEEVEE
jgi:hypothetical protein